MDVSVIPAAAGCSYPKRRGNFIQPLVDGIAAFAAIADAAERAKRSVWLTVAFLDPHFELPGGRGSLLPWLQRLAERGLDVRVIFWRNNAGSGFSEEAMFSGLASHRDQLSLECPAIKARWDRAHGAYCQHQKSWIMDAGQPTEVAFVGGINLVASSVVMPGHVDGPSAQTHDVYALLRGPCATDVHHNFVQRWNEASESKSADGWWGTALSTEPPLRFPQVLSPEAGKSEAQIQRTVRAGRYADRTPAVDAAEFPIDEGEFSVFEQYKAAIVQARRTIYIENQALGHLEIVQLLDAACSRGVEVIVLLPAQAERQMKAARARPESKPFFDSLAALGRHPNFQLAGIAAKHRDGRRPVYVHDKLMLIDDYWATIGSCNIGARSFFGDTELNLSFWCRPTVVALRTELFKEHLDIDTSDMDDRQAMAMWREIAKRNALLGLAATEPWKGLAFALDPATYGM
jgi:cardiolipin synthase